MCGTRAVICRGQPESVSSASSKKVNKNRETPMDHGRRSVLGLALLGTVHSLVAAHASAAGSGDQALGQLSGQRRSQLDHELAEIARDPSCELASLAVLAIRDGKGRYEGQFGRRFIGDSSNGSGLP